MGHVCWQHFALHFDFTLFLLNGQVAMPAYITFLERTISTQGTSLNEPHKQAVQGFPQRKPVRDMHSFLGLVAATAVAMDQTVTLTQVLRDDG